MSIIRRGGYIFIAWIGDHSPRHIHVYRDEKLILKWDLDNHSTNYRKSIDKLLLLLHILDCEVDLIVRAKSA